MLETASFVEINKTNEIKYPDRVEIIVSNKNKYFISSNVEDLLKEDFEIFSGGLDFVECSNQEFKKTDDYKGMLDGVSVRVLMYERY